MIVAETPTAYRFITQPAHARLAGAFAERWGGASFDRPEPYPAVVAAAHTHDDGWWAYDRQPHLGDDGTPVNFTEVPARTWIHLYDRGIAEVVDLDRYAGLLVSMHGTGLRRRRYGLSPAWPATPAAFEAFVDREEARQRDLLDGLVAAADDRVSEADDRLLAALHETGTAPDGTTSRLWANYRLLQAWDSLSLAFCTSVEPPAETTVDAVPRRPDGPATTLAITAGSDRACRLDPYPFRTDPVVVRVPARTVDKTAFDTERDLVDAYFAAGREAVEIRLRPAA